MSEWSDSKSEDGERFSSLMDGELERSDVAAACARWRDDASARAQWHAYHLIGDALRSEDLVSTSRRDAAFLASFRKRLSEEPVVLAPMSQAVPEPATKVVLPPRKRGWATPAAVAAGFMVVAGALVVTQMPADRSQPDAGAAVVAKTPSADGAVLVVDTRQAASAAQAGADAVPVDGRLIRDARLDEYLAAHKRFGGSSVSGGPSGFLRNAVAEGSDR